MRTRAAPRDWGPKEGRRHPSAERLGQSDDDALGASDVSEWMYALVLRDLADRFGAMSLQAGNDVRPTRRRRSVRSGRARRGTNWVFAASCKERDARSEAAL